MRRPAARQMEEAQEGEAPRRIRWRAWKPQQCKCDRAAESWHFTGNQFAIVHGRWQTLCALAGGSKQNCHFNDHRRAARGAPFSEQRGRGDIKGALLPGRPTARLFMAGSREKICAPTELGRWRSILQAPARACATGALHPGPGWGRSIFFVLTTCSSAPARGGSSADGLEICIRPAGVWRGPSRARRQPEARKLDFGGPAGRAPAPAPARRRVNNK